MEKFNEILSIFSIVLVLGVVILSFGNILNKDNQQKRKKYILISFLALLASICFFWDKAYVVGILWIGISIANYLLVLFKFKKITKMNQHIDEESVS
jgi:hypothetical protein